VRRVRSLGAVRRFLSDDENIKTYYSYIYDVYKGLSGDDVKKKYRSHLNRVIVLFDLGAKLQPEKLRRWDYMWTEERKASVRDYVCVAKITNEKALQHAGHGHLALSLVNVCKVDVFALAEMSDDECISFLLDKREELEAYKWSAEDLSYLQIIVLRGCLQIIVLWFAAGSSCSAIGQRQRGPRAAVGGEWVLGLEWEKREGGGVAVVGLVLVRERKGGGGG